jgi:hypothetical protein
MDRSSRTLGRLLHACGVVLLLCGGCGGTEPEQDLLAGIYSVPFDPPMTIDAGGACQRVITYAILGVGDREHSDFDLSINVGDDCRSTGGAFTFFGIQRHGTYAWRGDTLTFTPDQEPWYHFPVQPEGEYLRVFLPKGYGQLAAQEVELRLGPRSPL